ncbi:MAG: response regulator [Deferrisomatales bacterium]
MRALLVEDNAVFRSLLRSILCAWFPTLEICEAEDLAQAHTRFREQAPQVVFVDIGLPDGNGLDLVRRIKHEAPATTVAVCTSHEQPTYEAAAWACGADCFLSKRGLHRDQVARVVHLAQAAGRGG